MRSLILPVAVATALLTAPTAFAAPTCENRSGVTVRCATPGAMPVGWSLSREERARQISKPKSPTTNDLLEVICVLGVFFAWMALLPDFDGWRTGDWDGKRDDDGPGKGTEAGRRRE